MYVGLGEAPSVYSGRHPRTVALCWKKRGDARCLTYFCGGTATVNHHLPMGVGGLWWQGAIQPGAVGVEGDRIRLDRPYGEA